MSYIHIYLIYIDAFAFCEIKDAKLEAQPDTADDQKTTISSRNVVGTQLTVLMVLYNPSNSECADIMTVDYACIEAV